MPPIVVTGKKLPAKAEAILKEVLQAAGLVTAEVSGTSRTVAQQAQAIVDYYNKHGQKEAKKTYGTGPGGAAIEIYEKELNVKPISEVLRLMAAVIRDELTKERLSGGQKHLMHISDTHCAFDVAPSSITDREAFVREACKHPKVSRFLHPGSNPPDHAFHFEIPN